MREAAEPADDVAVAFGVREIDGAESSRELYRALLVSQVLRVRERKNEEDAQRVVIVEPRVTMR